MSRSSPRSKGLANVKTELLKAMATRRSIRSFKHKPVSEELLLQILEAARQAPSAGNCQARDIIVVRSPEVRKQLSEAALGQCFIDEAPLNLVVCAVRDRSAYIYGGRGRELYCILDAAASVENILLAAHMLGLGTCWVGAFHDELVSRILKLPRNLRPVGIIPVGYSDEAPGEVSRMPLDEFVHLESYGSYYKKDSRDEELR